MVYRYNISTAKCECANNLDGALLCRDPGRAYLRIDFCMTLDNNTNMLIAAKCHRGHYNSHNMINGLLPNDTSLIMESQCTPNNRKGYLCSKCADGYGVAVTSLTPNCVPCTLSVVPAILLYLLIELLPITIFFMVIVIFRINISAGPLLGYFIYCQAYTFTTNQSMLFNIEPFTHTWEGSPTHISYFLAGIWALCPVNILPPICISHRISTMDAIVMKYIRVFYPLVVTLFTYFLIELHARNFKLVVYLWRPVQACLRKVNVQIAIKDSKIHGYATLYILSFSIISYVSFELLNLIDVIREDSHCIKRRLQNDPTVSAYSGTHAPYVIITYVTLFLFWHTPWTLAMPLSIWNISTSSRMHN